MANEPLIAYQQQLKQVNTNNIASYNQTITSIEEAIVQMNLNIDGYNTQKTEYEEKIADAEAGNALIDETIAILSE